MKHTLLLLVSVFTFFFLSGCSNQPNLENVADVESAYEKAHEEKPKSGFQLIKDMYEKASN